MVLNEVASLDEPTTDEAEIIEEKEAAQQNANIVPPLLVEKLEFALRMQNYIEPSREETFNNFKELRKTTACTDFNCTFNQVY